MPSSSGLRLSFVIGSSLAGLFLVASLFGFRPTHAGADGVAGAILFGSSLVAQAIFFHREGDGPSAPKSAFVPDDLAADALATRDD